MTRFALIILVFGSAFIVGNYFNYALMEATNLAIEYFFNSLILLNGILPIDTFFLCLELFFYAISALITFKLLKWALGDS